MNKGDSGSHRFILIGAVVICTHLVCFLSYGATYWFDSIVYFELFNTLFQRGSFADFYSGDLLYLFQHVQFGPSLLLKLAHLASDSSVWQIYALLQHIFAVLSTIYLLSALARYVSPVTLWTIAVFLSLHPFYQAFHNAIMTESLAGSMLLLMAGSSLRLIADPGMSKRDLMVFAIAGVLGVQFRVYLFLFAVTFSMCIFFSQSRALVLKLVLPLSLVFVSLLFFPVARWLYTGKWFLPNTDCISVVLALWSNTEKNGAAEAILASQDLPDDLDVKEIAEQGLNYEQAVLWCSYLARKGVPDAEIRETMRCLAWKIRLHSWSSISSQLDAALAGVGLVNLSFFHNESDILSEGMARNAWRAHQRQHFLWLSWASDDNYTETLGGFLDRFRASRWYHPAAVDSMRDAIGANLRISKGQPFGAGLISLGSDFWFYGWLSGLFALLFKKKNSLFLILLTPVLMNYVILLLMGFGNIRYAYLIFPFLIISTCCSVEVILQYLFILLSYFNNSIFSKQYHFI